jgi:hypothetical protein
LLNEEALLFFEGLLRWWKEVPAEQALPSESLRRRGGVEIAAAAFRRKYYLFYF